MIIVILVAIIFLVIEWNMTKTILRAFNITGITATLITLISVLFLPISFWIVLIIWLLVRYRA